MAGLPPKPKDYDEYTPRRYPDDRGRPAPTSSDRYSHYPPRDYHPSRSPHPSRSRSTYGADSYVATDSYIATPGDTYIASEYARRGEQDKYKEDWDRYHANERQRRGIYEREPARHDHERGYDRRQGDARDRDYPTHFDRDRRWEARSSPRRPTDHNEPYRQHPSSSRRPPSPRRSQAHSRPRSRSPSPRQVVRLGNHSISNSPHSPYKHNLPRDGRSVSPRRRTATPPRHRLPRRSRSPSASPTKAKEEAIDIKLERLSSPGEPPLERKVVVDPVVKPKSSPTPPPLVSPPAPQQIPAKSDAIPTGPRFRPTIKQEVTHPNIPTGPASSFGEKDKGKQKEQPVSATALDRDVKMRSRSPSPPREPRARPSIRGHSPPRGPRNAPRNQGWTKTPTSPASFHLPTKPGWNNRHMSMNTSTSFGQSPLVKPAEPEVVLPPIPPYQPKPLTTAFDAEIVRVQTHRAHLISEHTGITSRARRALHELDMASIDLRAAESRRKVAGSHIEKARAGVLGIDAVHPTKPGTP